MGANTQHTNSERNDIAFLSEFIELNILDTTRLFINIFTTCVTSYNLLNIAK